LNRSLFKIEISQTPVSPDILMEKTAAYTKTYGLSPEEVSYLISSDTVSTDMYREEDDSISILYKDGVIKDISAASDMLNIHLLSKKIKKYYLCFLQDSK
jgi:hypothetical protein